MLGRVAGVLLALYGISGLLAGGLAYFAARETFGQARAVTAAVAGQQSDLREDLKQIATTTGDASVAADGFATSLERAQKSLATAAQASANLSTSFAQVSGLSAIDLFGVRPFEQLGISMGQSANEFRVLSEEIQTTSDSLGANVQDVRRVSTDMREIQRRVERVSTNVEQMGTGVDTLRNIRGLEMAVSWIVLWLVVQSIFWLAAGLILLISVANRLRAARRRELEELARPDPALGDAKG
jgi:hypothetical protein